MGRFRGWVLQLCAVVLDVCIPQGLWKQLVPPSRPNEAKVSIWHVRQGIANHDPFKGRSPTCSRAGIKPE